MRKRTYREYMLSHAWAERRRQACTDAGFRCYGCNRRASRRRPVDVHHLTYKHFGHEPPEDLVLMCYVCHHLTHQRVSPSVSIREATEMVRLIRRRKTELRFWDIPGIKEAMTSKRDRLRPTLSVAGENV